MKAEVYIGLGTQAKMIWDGELDCLPRIGEDVTVWNGKSLDGYTVERIHHELPSGARGRHRAKLFVRS